MDWATQTEKKVGQKVDGYGTFHWPSGSNYVGEWKNGKASGYGIYTWSKGEKYIGEHIDGKADGYGIILDQDGYKYIGEFKEKNRNGLGIYSMPSGTKYFGQWKNEKEKHYGLKMFFDGFTEQNVYKNGVIENKKSKLLYYFNYFFIFEINFLKWIIYNCYY